MKISILAPIGPFGSVEEASTAEESLDWQAAPGSGHRACILSFAAVEMRDHLIRVPGTECHFAALEEDGPEQSSAEIKITITTLQDSEDRAEDIGSQGYMLSTEIDKTGSPVGYLVLGNDAQGALYGTYELLHAFGFRWFSPDPWDQITPEEIFFSVVNVTEKPSFTLRGFWATDDRGTEEFLLWMARNKLNLWSAEQPEKSFCRKLGIRFTAGGHSIFARYADPSMYFDDHPEWYGLQNGARSPKIDMNVGDNICFANGNVRHHIAESLAQDLAAGQWKWVDLINVWALDNGKYCTCDACKALGNPTDQIMLLANDCRRAIVAAQKGGTINREVIVSIPAYHETLDIPSRELPPDFDHEGIVATFFPIERCFVHAFADRRCTEINKPLVEFWDNWTGNPENHFKGPMLVGEYYNVSAYASLAIPATGTMAADIPYYYRSGARLMHFMHIGTGLWGPLSLTNSQFAAMLWYHEIDVGIFTQDYFNSRYRGQAGVIGEAYDTLERAMVNAKPMKHYAGMARHTLRNTIREPAPFSATIKSRENLSAVSAENSFFTTRHLRYNGGGAESGPSLTESLDSLFRVERILDDALLSSASPDIRKRIASDLRRVRYTRNAVAFTYHAVRLRMFEAVDDAHCALLEARALQDVGETLRREKEMPKLKPESKEDDWHRFYRDGLTATWLSEDYEQIMNHYGLAQGPFQVERGEIL